MKVAGHIAAENKESADHADQRQHVRSGPRRHASTKPVERAAFDPGDHVFLDALYRRVASVIAKIGFHVIFLWPRALCCKHMLMLGYQAEFAICAAILASGLSSTVTGLQSERLILLSI